MAAAGTRGGFGWVILVIALAVPGVLFYNWWSHLKAEQARAVAAKAAARVPEGGVFSPQTGQAKLVNPMTPTPTPSTGPVAAAPSAVQTASAATNAATAAPAPAPAGAAPVPEPAAASNAAAAPSASTAAVASAPALKRDPMLSPYDQVRILEEEEKKRLAAEALANANRPVKKGPPKKEDITKKIELQGIVSGEDGNKAIVNGDLVGVGELILGKVKIVRITQAGVVFDYQGKKFTKSVSQD